MTDSHSSTTHHHRHNVTECGHIVTVYVIPDILHCTAFMIGFIYFRITEGEPMYSLMEKVTIDLFNSIYFQKVFSWNE